MTHVPEAVRIQIGQNHRTVLHKLEGSVRSSEPFLVAVLSTSQPLVEPNHPGDYWARRQEAIHGQWPKLWVALQVATSHSCVAKMKGR